MQIVIVRIFVPVASVGCWWLIFHFPSSFFPGLTETSSWCRLLKPVNSHGLWSPRCIHGYSTMLMYKLKPLYYLLYSWIMWHIDIHIWYMYHNALLYITYGHIKHSMKNYTISRCFGSACPYSGSIRLSRLLLPPDSESGLSRETKNQWSQLCHESPTQGGLFWPKLFPAKVTDFRWGMFSPKSFWHFIGMRSYFRMFQHEHMKSNTRLCPLFLEFWKGWIPAKRYICDQDHGLKSMLRHALR